MTPFASKSAKPYILAVIVGSFLFQAAAPVAAEKNAADISLPVRIALYQAQQLIADGNVAEAVRRLKSFREKGGKHSPRSKNDPEARGYALVAFTAGNGLLMLEQTEEAAGFYAEAVRLQPNFHPAWLNLAKCLSETGRHADAADSFLEAYATSPSPKPELLYYSAVSAMLSGRHQAALRAFEKLAAAHPGDVRLEWKESLVQLYLALEMPHRALPVIQDLAENTTGDKQTRWQEVLLYHYLSLGLKEKALFYVKTLTRRRPLEPKWWQGQVHLYLQDNRYREALVAMLAKELLTPLSEAELALSGDLYFSLDVPDQAVKYYERYLARRPELEVLIKTVRSYMRLNRPQKALQWLEAGLEKWDDSRLLMFKGRLLYQQEKFREAAGVFRAAAGKSNKNPGDAWLMAGYAAWQAGDTDMAESDLVKAMGYKTQRQEARQALAELRKIRRQMHKGNEINQEAKEKPE